MDAEFERPDWDPDDEGEFEEGLVFAIMSFAPEMAAVFETIRRACERLHLRAVRVDQQVGSGFVIRRIIDLIERAEFLVVDLSDERPNVYYELGYAHGVGNEAEDILLVARSGTSLHFDIAPLQVRLYDSPEHLDELVETNLREMILATRGDDA